MWAHYAVIQQNTIWQSHSVVLKHICGFLQSFCLNNNIWHRLKQILYTLLLKLITLYHNHLHITENRDKCI